MVDYTVFWETLEKSEYTQYTLIEKFGISSRVINYLKHNKNLNTKTLNDLCVILECDFSDIVTYIPDSSDTNYDAIKEHLNKK